MEVLPKIYKDVRDKATALWDDRSHSDWEPKLSALALDLWEKLEKFKYGMGIKCS